MRLEVRARRPDDVSAAQRLSRLHVRGRAFETRDLHASSEAPLAPRVMREVDPIRQALLIAPIALPHVPLALVGCVTCHQCSPADAARRPAK